ncbi:hypothetical protein [Paracidovorax valerianellae]|uniref:hypothetical protein n=1 Tax=Paracidovorax valerianellae TaxID=187868 RepID=UPI00230430D3|nr:hypothetical protein [Paracidovorax valerianellae]MDA8447121.1 hypothetical protein [Paracidovorax valerianellae]
MTGQAPLGHGRRSRAAWPLVAALLLGGSAAVMAADRACVIEGSVAAGGKTVPVKDCMEFTGSIPAGQLKASCDGLAQASAQMGGKAGKVTLVAQCPRPASGACKGLMGQPLDAYYYDLSPEAAKEKRKACETSSAAIKGGTWSSGQ